MSLQGLYNWREVEMTELAGTLWAGYYAVIAEVNALLARIDAVVTLDETEKLEKMRIEEGERDYNVTLAKNKLWAHAKKLLGGSSR